MLKRIAGNAFPRLRDYVRIRRGYMGSVGGPPKIFRSTTFNEKIQYRKLFERDLRLPERADKILVKDFVTQKLGSHWITPTLWFGDSLPEQRDWPIPFVIKANHGSTMNYFVRTQHDCDWGKIEALCNKWLSETYGEWGGEWLYSQIKPRLLVEPFIGELAELPIDYKLWTFHGRVEFIQVDTDREISHKRTMFDRNWNRLPFTTIYRTDQREIERPISLSDMIEAAEILSENISFVRVDFYEIEGSPRFGEMTYYPDSGWGKFIPSEYDLKIGRLLS